MANIYDNLSGDNELPSPADLPWSQMLVELAQPYMGDEPEIEELEEKLELAQIAWNMAVMKKRDGYLYHNYRNNFIATELDQRTQKLVDELVMDKEAKFGEYEVMLDDCEIVEDEEDGKATVNVVAKSYEQFMQDVFFSTDEDDGDDEFDDDEDDDEEENIPEEPEYVNRSAVAILPRQPFWDWLKQLDEGSEQDFERNNTVYLIKTKDSEGEIAQWLNENFQKLFENELNGWTEDENEWPQNRDFQLFTKWFDVQFCSMVYDVQTSALTKI